MLAGHERDFDEDRHVLHIDTLELEWDALTVIYAPCYINSTVTF